MIAERIGLTAETRPHGVWVPALRRDDVYRILRRRALGLRPAQMLVQPRHDLDEIAGPRAVIELVRQDAVPAVAAGGRRARPGGKKRPTGPARGGRGLE